MSHRLEAEARALKAAYDRLAAAARNASAVAAAAGNGGYGMDSRARFNEADRRLGQATELVAAALVILQGRDT